MPISPITTTSVVNPATQTSAEKALDLGKDAFMKMMIENLRNQDPSAAADNKEFVQQLSQMTMLEQITNMANATASLASETRDARAVGMLGRTVGWMGADRVRQEGVVEGVDSSTGTPLLKIGGQLVHTSAVVDVR